MGIEGFISDCSRLLKHVFRRALVTLGWFFKKAFTAAPSRGVTSKGLCPFRASWWLLRAAMMAAWVRPSSGGFGPRESSRDEGFESTDESTDESALLCAGSFCTLSCSDCTLLCSD